MLARLLIGLGLSACCAQAATPLRVVVLTRLSQSLPDALKRFEEHWGTGRIVLSHGDATAPPADLDQADVVLAYGLHSEEARSLAPRIRPLLARGIKVLAHWPEGGERHWGLKQDPARLQEVVEYWNYGGVENMARLLAFLYLRVAGRPGIEVEPPQRQLTTGIHHPRAPLPFASLEAYSRWYASQRLVPPDAPKVGILFYHTNLKNRDMAHIDALIAALERHGLAAVAVFGWPPALCEPFLTGPEGSAVDALFALNLGFAKPDDVEFLVRLNVHVIDLMTTKQTRREWLESPQGVRTDQLALQVSAPERAGATEPITFAATERSRDGKTVVSVPIDERIGRAVERARRWIALRRTPNAAKRVALLYYNNPPGKGSISASYLNVPGTLTVLLRRLRDEGYLTGQRVPEERELLTLLERSGRNIEQWAPGELESMVESGHVTLISMAQYRRWLGKLPKRFRAQVDRAWGPPELSTLMTIRTRQGKPYFVVPGLRLGNIFLGPQPLRSSFARAAASQHDTTLPPPHSYVAAYLWLREQFRADAIAHVGRHGTLEFLPGKNTGQAGDDAAEAILGDVPAPYFYILDGGGESMTARRRGAATILSHLTPLLAPGGAQEAMRPLREALDRYSKSRVEAPGLAAQYQAAACEEIRKNNLDRQLRLDLDTARWSEVAGKVEAFLEDAESATIPLGVHTLGVMPREELQIEALAEFLRSGLQSEGPPAPGGPYHNWAAALVGGGSPALDPAWPATQRGKVATQWEAGRAWLENLRMSPARELDETVRVLRGEYLASGPSGDPLRSPASLPSGRNLHDFDPSLIPTKAACALGRKLGDDLMDRIRRQTGRAANKVSLVLWYGETIRHQGAMECQALYLMGVEPRWNSRGAVDDLRLVPESELGRPRVDVVVTIAGIYRDGFPDKALLLDRASRLVQQAGDNPLSRNTKRAVDELRKQGLTEDEARRAAAARVFGPAPGDYGGGVAHLTKQSKDAQAPGAVAEAYLRHNNHAYTTDRWGETMPRALATQLQGNQAIVHSRATNLYGVLDNDDFFDFAGGLSAATKRVNHGAAPQLFVANLRRPGRERLDDFRQFLSVELHGRVWNTKWIREMQRSGYAGAREMADHLENIYGWQATTPEQVDGSVWQKSYEVYVEDRQGLGLKEFFSQENPHARQYLLARLLEVDRQGSHRFSAGQRAVLVREYLRGVLRSGVGCSANTCGNRALQHFVVREASALGSAAEAREFQSRFDRASRGTAPGPAVVARGRPGKPARRPFRLFHVSAEEFAAAHPVVKVGSALFLAFFAASLLVGVLQSLGLRWGRRPLVELHVGKQRDRRESVVPLASRQ
ncbi:cobaltochelatase subunit CobN [uncultured Paludibaculum sp.]|uniref:cobaltochelatase subunit CobN n=1 Tax=uncultured Paludibaculum sp. TaxID=1765020 RepID=UPI002AAAB7B7|nr:cobaltochelatase subunit CobN [uncultured Paludibaculum sp.]